MLQRYSLLRNVIFLMYVAVIYLEYIVQVSANLKFGAFKFAEQINLEYNTPQESFEISLTISLIGIKTN